MSTQQFQKSEIWILKNLAERNSKEKKKTLLLKMHENKKCKKLFLRKWWEKNRKTIKKKIKKLAWKKIDLKNWRENNQK